MAGDDATAGAGRPRRAARPRAGRGGVHAGEAGEFVPFALTLSNDGPPSLLVAVEAETTAATLTMLQDCVRATAAGDRSLRACAFVSDVFAGREDAVRVHGEHRDGGPVIEAVAPYRISRLRRTVTFGALSAAAAPPLVWPR